MKEYQIEVTSVTVVYVEAESEEEAIKDACIRAFDSCPDINNAVVLDVIDLED